MLRSGIFAATLTVLASGCGTARPVGGSLAPATASPPAAAWTLAWSDEFDGPAGALVDSTRWVAEVGGHGGGNHELEYSTDRSQTASRGGAGLLVIRALREHYEGQGVARDFTSARLKTQGRFEQTYGRFEARLEIPPGQGLLPAFWMMDADINAACWPRCGEVDISEKIGHEPATVHEVI